MTNSALVLFSGGQDSTTCLAWALDRHRHVETVGFRLWPASCRGAWTAGHRSAPRLRRNGPIGSGPDHPIDLAATIAGWQPSADQRNGHRHDRRRPAKHLCSGPEPAVSCLRCGTCLPTGVCGGSSPACAKPTIPAILIAATTRLRRCRSRLTSGCSAVRPGDAADVARQGGDLGMRG